MTKPDAFALRESALNPFLFAEVGTELNGSQLTILSLLARLGSDPWAEADRLATLPKAAAISWLADRIARTPLTAKALGEAPATAARLIGLLPEQNTIRGTVASVQLTTKPMPKLAMAVVLLAAVALGVLAGAIHTQRPPVEAAPITQHDG
jgi:hypothetical protein